MRTGTDWEITLALLLCVALSACTGSPSLPVRDPMPEPPITSARYVFSASGVRGVLDVSSSPPSICYSTQSDPARPIKIQALPAGAIAHVEESYSPRTDNFCDGTVTSALATDLLADPSGYQVVWSPRPDGSGAFSSLAAPGPA